MYLVGLIDDIYDLKPILKLIGQIVAFNRSILWNYNRFYFVSYGPDNSFGILSIPITIIWIVAITNAINLIDGLDGLASEYLALVNYNCFYCDFTS